MQDVKDDAAWLGRICLIGITVWVGVSRGGQSMAGGEMRASDYERQFITMEYRSYNDRELIRCVNLLKHDCKKYKGRPAEQA